MISPRLVALFALLLATTQGVSSRRLGGGEQQHADLTKMLSTVQNSTGLVAVGAFVASGDSLCAVGAAGNLWNAPDAPPVHLWNSPWHAGSLTKSMTSSLIALMVNDESVPLTWDTRLGHLFPAEAGDTPYANVTLAHLVSHRGGFPRELSLETRLEEVFPSQVDNTPYANVTIAQLVSLGGGSNTEYSEEPPPQPLLDITLMEQRRAAMMWGFTTNPVVPPILNGSYSNLGYIIAGALLENITGVVWEDLITERLFGALGMDSAFFLCPNTTESPLGHVYRNETGSLEAVPSSSWCNCLANLLSWCPCGLPAVYAPAGSVYMTLLDYVKYYQWHLAVHRGEDTSGLLSAEEFQRLHTSLGLIGPGYPDVHVQFEYGYGWMVVESMFFDGDSLTHDGSNTMWYAQVIVAPGENRVFFFGTNSVTTKSGEPPLGLNTIFDNMLMLSNETTCTPLNQLNVKQDVEPHLECDELIYGNVTADDGSGVSSKAVSSVKASPMALILMLLLWE